MSIEELNNHTEKCIQELPNTATWWGCAKKITRIAVGIIPLILCRPTKVCALFSQKAAQEESSKPGGDQAVGSLCLANEEDNIQNKISYCILQKRHSLDLSKLRTPKVLELLEPHTKDLGLCKYLDLSENPSITDIPEYLFSLPNTLTINL